VEVIAHEPPPVEWALASIPLDGHDSGDGALVLPLPRGTLVAVSDGLGHGPEAAAATSAALDALRASASPDVAGAIARCHAKLARTRGVALTVAWIDASEGLLRWSGVGNVDAVIVRAQTGRKEHLLMRGGVVGLQLPSLRVADLGYAPGDLLVMATDGIRSGFADHLRPLATCQTIAQELMAWGRRPTDDALVLALRLR
jgi:phosphoserine phosphatase RsbX